MILVRTGLYAGSFDPVTFGHMDMIYRGAQLFDELVVGVGTNPMKSANYTFTADQRAELVIECIQRSSLANVRVEELKQEYTVHLAEQLGAGFLLRGIRNLADFESEQLLNSINRDWVGDVESVFLMPDVKYKDISSSVVKGLIGYTGWENKVRMYVPGPVLHAFQRKFWQQTSWIALCHRIGAEGDLMPYFDFILNQYWNSSRAYHTMDHVLDCLVEFEAVRDLAEHPDEVELAIWLHDLIYIAEKGANNELESAAVAEKIIKANKLSVECPRVLCLIISTDHKEPGSRPDMKMIMDIDLVILGKPWEEFGHYDDGIRQEYSHVPLMDYLQGRVGILQSFLDRPQIYQTNFFYKKYEGQARENLKRKVVELIELASELKQIRNC